MTTTLLNIDLSRGASRVRLFFSAAMAAGAFTSTSYYAVVNTDGNGPNPTQVVQVFAVAGNAEAVELAIEPPFTPGAIYDIVVTNAPAVDTSLVSGTVVAQQGTPLQDLPNVEPDADDLGLLLYNRDIVFDGNDFVETATGDLGTISGRDNWYAAIYRRETSSGLRWDRSYSPMAADYVNAPDVYRTPLAGRMVAQAKADDRTSQATVQVSTFAADSSGNGFLFALTIVGRDGLDPATITVPTTLPGT